MAASRTKVKIKDDITAAGRITRLDIYEVLWYSKDKKDKEKEKDLKDFLDTCPTEITQERKGGEFSKTTEELIMQDYKSYSNK